MTDTAARAFDSQAAEYESARRRLVPVYDAFYGAAVAALDPPPQRILDLGAGTGLLAREVVAAHPGAELTLLDAAPAMLAQARATLGDRAAYVEADLTDPLPAGPWDAVVSALAIHHLEDPAKQDLFARVHAALAPGGVFVNAEQVAGATPQLEAANARWHEARARALGATNKDWRGYLQRRRHDRLATVADQLAWLRAAGFAEAETLYEEHCFAVLRGRRAG
jgi:tRNA (cmo5U34)-methyltransferase